MPSDDGIMVEPNSDSTPDAAIQKDLSEDVTRNGADEENLHLEKTVSASQPEAPTSLELETQEGSTGETTENVQSNKTTISAQPESPRSVELEVQECSNKQVRLDESGDGKVVEGSDGQEMTNSQTGGKSIAVSEMDNPEKSESHAPTQEYTDKQAKESAEDSTLNILGKEVFPSETEIDRSKTPEITVTSPDEETVSAESYANSSEVVIQEYRQTTPQKQDEPKNTDNEKEHENISTFENQSESKSPDYESNAIDENETSESQKKIQTSESPVNQVADTSKVAVPPESDPMAQQDSASESVSAQSLTDVAVPKHQEKPATSSTAVASCDDVMSVTSSERVEPVNGHKDGYDASVSGNEEECADYAEKKTKSQDREDAHVEVEISGDHSGPEPIDVAATSSETLVPLTPPPPAPEEPTCPRRVSNSVRFENDQSERTHDDMSSRHFLQTPLPVIVRENDLTEGEEEEEEVEEAIASGEGEMAEPAYSTEIETPDPPPLPVDRSSTVPSTQDYKDEYENYKVKTQQEIKELNLKIEHLEENVKVKDSTIKDMETRFETMMKANNTVDRKEHENKLKEEYENKNQTLETEVSDLKTKVQTSKTEIEKKDKELEKQKTTIDQQNAEITRLKNSKVCVII